MKIIKVTYEIEVGDLEYNAIQEECHLEDSIQGSLRSALLYVKDNLATITITKEKV